MVRSMTDARPSPLAGTWYPGRVETLNAMMDEFLQAAKPEPPAGKLLGLLAPHAGYRYSGPIAAHAFGLVRDMAFDTVVVIGPMHHPIEGDVLTSAHSAYETPLGTVPVNRDILGEIERSIPMTALRYDPEHSVEIELPFLQHVLQPGFSLVPLMLRNQSQEQTDALSETLATVLRGQNVLLVASSDLSHFYPQEIAHQLDGRLLNCVETMDAEAVTRSNETRTAFACGYGAIATVMNTIKAWQGDSAEIVGYGTSGDVTGDFGRVVGYGAATFCQTNSANVR